MLSRGGGLSPGGLLVAFYLDWKVPKGGSKEGILMDQQHIFFIVEVQRVYWDLQTFHQSLSGMYVLWLRDTSICNASASHHRTAFDLSSGPIVKTKQGFRM